MCKHLIFHSIFSDSGCPSSNELYFDYNYSPSLVANVTFNLCQLAICLMIQAIQLELSGASKVSRDWIHMNKMDAMDTFSVTSSIRTKSAFLCDLIDMNMCTKDAFYVTSFVRPCT